MTPTAEALVPSTPPPAAVDYSAQFMPVMAIARAVERYNAVLTFTKEIMKEGKDYGTVPGSEKPCLLKPGAEKLASFFGLSTEFIVIEKVQEWVGAEPFFYYWFKCRLWRGTPNQTGSLMVAEADGSCNSRESKYRYRWVSEAFIPAGLTKESCEARGGRLTEPEFAINKKETTGRYGKPLAYWLAFDNAIAAGTATPGEKEKSKGGKLATYTIDSTVYRVPNPDVCDQVNTIQKMAEKRAMIAAILIACNASEYFTQDLEDLDVIDMKLDGSGAYHAKEETPEQVKERRLAEERAKAGSNGTAPVGATEAPRRDTYGRAANRTAPEPLWGTLDRLKDKGGAETGVKMVRQWVQEATSEGVMEQHWKLCAEKNGIKPKGNDVSAMQDLLLDMYEFGTQARAEKAETTLFNQEHGNG